MYLWSRAGLIEWKFSVKLLSEILAENATSLVDLVQIWVDLPHQPLLFAWRVQLPALPFLLLSWPFLPLWRVSLQKT